MSLEKDYVLGTHDDEVARLALQNRVWRPYALDAWRRGGFGPGQTILDVGAGPGYAAVDLAKLVGGGGHVIAIDRSRRFLEVLESGRRELGLHQISTQELDLGTAELPDLAADAAWCRWIFTFVERPFDLLERVRSAMKPAGRLVVHEYFDYATWRAAPRCLELEAFVDAVMASWRAHGGDPDVGLRLPSWLHEAGFELCDVRPLVFAARPQDDLWLWLQSFLEFGRRRLIELELLTRTRADAIWEAFTAFATLPTALMVTPAVLEIHARARI